MSMAEWHVVVIDGNKISFDRVFFNVSEAHKMEKEKKKWLADQRELDPTFSKTMKVLREYY